MTDVIDVVIPARNARATIDGVIDPFYSHPAIGQIVVVINPPDQELAEYLLDNYYNRSHGSNVLPMSLDAAGKGEAVMFGLETVGTPHVVFCDADLTGLTEHHVSLLIADAVLGTDTLTIGLPEVPRELDERRVWTWPWVSGERCIPRKLVRPLILHGYLMETQINTAAYHAKMPLRFEWLIGCHAPYRITDKRREIMREEYRWGVERGLLPPRGKSG